jgi:hypothetical protein
VIIIGSQHTLRPQTDCKQPPIRDHSKISPPRGGSKMGPNRTAQIAPESGPEKTLRAPPPPWTLRKCFQTLAIRPKIVNLSRIWCGFWCTPADPILDIYILYSGTRHPNPATTASLLTPRPGSRVTGTSQALSTISRLQIPVTMGGPKGLKNAAKSLPPRDYRTS